MGQQGREIEQALLSRNLNNIEPMDPNLARTLTIQQVNSLSADSALLFGDRSHTFSPAESHTASAPGSRITDATGTGTGPTRARDGGCGRG